jgi:hypothetical protein
MVRHLRGCGKVLGDVVLHHVSHVGAHTQTDTNRHEQTRTDTNRYEQTQIDTCAGAVTFSGMSSYIMLAM